MSASRASEASNALYLTLVIRGVKTVEGNDESLYCHGNLIIPLIKRGMMSDYAHVNHASVSIHNHSSFPS